MAQKRGRKSAASLSVIPVAFGQRPAPPACLTDEESKDWLVIVNRLPADWFPEESWPLLIAYCRHIAAANRIYEQMSKTGDLADADNLKLFDRLGKMHERETRTQAVLATKLRLTQQSRMQAKTAASQAVGGLLRKPWEFNGR
jgi:hypothetical protein